MSDTLVYGLHAVAALLDRDPVGVCEVWLQDKRRHPLLRRAAELAAEHGIAVHRVPRATLDRMLAGARHQGVALRYRGCAPAKTLSLEALVAGLRADALFLVLDGVQDPHNLGACLRNADAAGARAVIVPRSRAAGLSPGARKVACGAAESIALLRVSNLATALAGLSDAGVQLVGATGAARESLYATDLTGPTALVLGGEESGLRRLTRERCDRLVRIPMDGVVESLNVSVAAGICLFEARRQRIASAGSMA